MSHGSGNEGNRENKMDWESESGRPQQYGNSNSNSNSNSNPNSNSNANRNSNSSRNANSSSNSNSNSNSNQSRQKQSQAQQSNQAVVQRQLFLEQVKDCTLAIKKYLEEASKPKEETNENRLMRMNYGAVQSVKLLNFSMAGLRNEDKSNNKKESDMTIDLALAQVAEFEEQCNFEFEKPGVRKRSEQFISSMTAMLCDKGSSKIGYIPNLKLTEQEDTQSAMQKGMREYLKQGHVVQERVENVSKNAEKVNSQHQQDFKDPKKQEKISQMQLKHQNMKAVHGESLYMDLPKNRQFQERINHDEHLRVLQGPDLLGDEHEHEHGDCDSTCPDREEEEEEEDNEDNEDAEMEEKDNQDKKNKNKNKNKQHEHEHEHDNKGKKSSPVTADDDTRRGGPGNSKSNVVDDNDKTNKNNSKNDRTKGGKNPQE